MRKRRAAPPTEQRDGLRLGDVLGEARLEQVERQEDGEADADLGAAVARQREREDGEDAEYDGRRDDRVEVVERLAADVQAQREARVVLAGERPVSARVACPAARRRRRRRRVARRLAGAERRAYQVELVAGHVAGRVDARRRRQRQTQLARVVEPRAEVHVAALVVEREVGDVDGAQAVRRDRQQPAHAARVLHQQTARRHRQVAARPAVRAAAQHRKGFLFVLLLLFFFFFLIMFF